MWHVFLKYENKRAHRDRLIILLQDILEILIEDIMIYGNRYDAVTSVLSVTWHILLILYLLMQNIRYNKFL